MTDPTSAARTHIHRALLSVSDKTGIVELASALVGAGVDVVSTGSTAKTIAAAGVPVSEVSEVTGFPEILDGRVKTLHPAVHAGILADLRKPSHVQQLAELDISPFELVVVNLYPFVQTVRSGADGDAVVEQIDIGGPTLIRAAAKNHANVAVVVDPQTYPELIAALPEGTTLAQRRVWAARAFAHTADYDRAISGWFRAQTAQVDDAWPESLEFGGRLLHPLRYGENPHQRAAVYADPLAAGLAQAEQLHGKEMSYNNYQDSDAAVRAVFDFPDPAVAVVKHANPCGIAIATPGADDPIADAHRKAHACDPLSAYGGVVAANREVTLGMAQAIRHIFTEVVVAPSYAPEALALLQEKKNLRILRLPKGFRREQTIFKQISGGVLVSGADNFEGRLQTDTWKLVSGEPAPADVLADLAFAWKACRSVKSNAILLAHGGASVGVGMGQVNRVDSAHLAVTRAGDRAAGAVGASDAFFPFPDGLQVLIDAGVQAVAQPGGSIHDPEVIAAAQKAGLTMYLTGERHFFH